MTTALNADPLERAPSRILVIDDDPDLRRAARVTLSAGRYKVTEADSAESGLRNAHLFPPELILCDLHLGSGSGFDVLTELRGRPATATIPLILITASDDTSVMRHGMDLGADDFLHKPFTAAQLLAAVEARLRRQGQLKARAEQVLRDVKARHCLLFESATDAIMVSAPPAWRFVEANAATLRMFGARTKEEFLAVSPWEASPERQPDGSPSAERAKVVIETALRDGSHLFEWTHRRFNGEVFPATVLLARLELSGQTLIQATVHDLTERRRAELALQDSESRFRSLFRSMAEGVALHEIVYADNGQPIDYRILDVNPAYERQTGITCEQARGRLAREVYGTSTAPYLDIFEKVARTGKAASFDTYFAPLRRHFQISICPPKEGQFATIFTDITGRKQAEEQLRKLSLAVEQSPASVVITDTAGRIEYVNPKFCSVTGYQPGEVLGQNPRILKSGENSPEAYRELWTRITRGQEWRGELRNRKKSGELFWEFVVISPIKNEQGSVTHFLAIKEDITDRKRKEQEHHLMEINLRQAQKLESIGQLAAGIAHEINTPTQYIGDNVRFFNRAMADLDRVLEVHGQLVSWLKAQGPVPEVATCILEGAAKVRTAYLRSEIPKAIGDALEGVERVSKIVRAMKEFSHPGAEEKQRLDLNRAIESTLMVSRNEWKYVAEVVVQLDPELPFVPCLPGEFNQVILNLVVNAAHAIADVVKDDACRKGQITVSTQTDGDWVEVHVQDTGTGIPAQIQHRIFEPFFTTKAVGKGSGQGLALARSVIADRHGGSIRFETEPGNGTTFIIRLPLHATARV